MSEIARKKFEIFVEVDIFDDVFPKVTYLIFFMLSPNAVLEQSTAERGLSEARIPTCFIE